VVHGYCRDLAVSHGAVARFAASPGSKHRAGRTVAQTWIVYRRAIDHVTSLG
jgi:hypothetical protein